MGAQLLAMRPVWTRLAKDRHLRMYGIDRGFSLEPLGAVSKMRSRPDDKEHQDLNPSGYELPVCCNDGPYTYQGGKGLVCKCGATLVMTGHFGAHAVQAWNEHCRRERMKHDEAMRRQPTIKAAASEPRVLG